MTGIRWKRLAEKYGPPNLREVTVPRCENCAHKVNGYSGSVFCRRYPYQVYGVQTPVHFFNVNNVCDDHAPKEGA